MFFDDENPDDSSYVVVKYKLEAVGIDIEKIKDIETVLKVEIEKRLSSIDILINIFRFLTIG